MNAQQRETTEAWIAALRSGEFVQTNGVLVITNEDTNDRAYCCLGVLCEIRDDAEVYPGEVLVTEPDGYQIGLEVELGDTRFHEWTGLASEGPYITMNDDDGASFNEIADAIEAELQEHPAE